MYFIKRGGTVYHILEDLETGKAPEPCGTSLGSLDLSTIRRGTSVPNVSREKPTDFPMCKHCRKSQDNRF